jgi:pilus assembly protein Flp/PilA
VNNVFLRLLVRVQILTMHEEGQDLVEYALVTGLLAVAAVATLKNTATSITGIFSNIKTTLNAA